MDILTVEGLSKRYAIGSKVRREIWALRDVSFTVPKGEVLGIIGPNGAGKTTLLKVLSRVTPPTEGRVVGHGRVIPLLALGAGFQQDLSGRENIFLNAAIYGIAPADVTAQIDEIVAFADIGDFIDVPVKRYSSGMYLRLAFSVAINMKPDILLADEILAVGDLDFQERCLERVKEAGAAGMSVLFVSHDMSTIARLCDRVLWLSGGEIVKIGDAEEVVAAYQSSATSFSGRSGKVRGGAHRNEWGELLSIMLTSADGREVGAVRRADEVCIKVGVRTDRPDLFVRFVVHVHKGAALAFRVASGMFPAEVPDAYVATVSIPPNLLAETMYAVDVEALLIPSTGGKRPLAAYNALTFRVFDPATERRDQLGGVVAPPVEWSFEGRTSGPREVTRHPLETSSRT
jgi:ABC-type polysaccharide/polyol phosphate transport system ATPase subunit